MPIDRSDLVAAARTFGYRLDTRSDFLRDCEVEGLAARAGELMGAFVMWDPLDDCDGFLLVGDNMHDLAADWYGGHGADACDLADAEEKA